MAKKVIILENHEQAERLVLEHGFRLSPEERIRWLYKQLEITSRMNPYSPEITAYQLRKKRG